ncbi:uncharacterized protein TNCV_1187551 [Trichonephila clavipes]|nr:uncharacterized protein TNCV_1187551 [Trichonephila clavipes]
MSCEQWYSTLKGNVRCFEMASYFTMTMPDHILLVAYWKFRSRTTVEILPYPPCSPDLTPCDFWLFPRLKKPLRGKRFASNKVCVKAA